MKILIDYWYVIFAILALLAIAAVAVARFFRLPRAEQEEGLGGGTGKLKLRQVYDAFLTKFPWLAPVIPFEQFSGLVDDALEEMRKLLEDNKAVQQLVTGEE